MKKTKQYVVALITNLFIFMSLGQSFPSIDKSIIFKKYDFSVVDKFIEDGLPNKAISELLAIQKEAIQENNLYNFNQCFERIIESSYSAGLEAVELQNLFFKQHELLTSLFGPMRNIVVFNLDKWFENIVYRNIFSFDEESLDWSINDKKQKLVNGDASILQKYYFSNFLLNDKDLMKIGAEQIFDTAGWIYKPTLYDVLAERFLSTFGDDDKSVCNWDNTLEFYQEELSPKNRVYANLEQLHQTNERWDTYAFCVERRILDCNQNELTNEKLLPVFEKFQNELVGFPASNRFAYRRALIYAEKASQYNWQTNPADELSFLVALKIIDEAISVQNTSEFNDDLEKLKKQIISPSLELNFDDDIRPSEHNFMNVKFRNLANAEMVLFKIDNYEEESIYSENALKKLHLIEIGTHKIGLLDDPKHLTHDKDFLLTELNKPGHYLVMVGESLQRCREALQAEKLYEVENVAFKLLSLTNLVARKSNDHEGVTILVNNLETGKPIKHAKVIVDLEDGISKTKSKKVFETDKNGSVKLKGISHSKYTIYHKKDSISDYLYFYPSVREKASENRVFTDRRLYRPGQSVFYKTLSFDELGNGFQSNSGKSTKIVFKDLNGQILYDRTSVANEFGSTSGSFVLPKSGIPLGNVSIYLGDVYTESIQIEEYKRPTFTVSFETPKDKIALGQTLKMEGKVNAFAGYPIANAQVKINISEVRYFPRWCIFMDEYRNHDTTIAVKTDEKGFFKLEFVPTTPKDVFGIFYAFDAVVADITGETQTANYTMFVGNSALSISTNTKEKYRIDEEIKISCNVENSKGMNQEGKRIQYEIRKYHNETWFRKTRQEAEFKDFSENDLKQWKPDLTYFKEDQEPKHMVICIGEVESGKELDLKTWLTGRTGNFEIHFTLKDEFGDSAQLIEKFIVWNPESKKGQHQEEFWMETNNSNPEMGEEAEIYLGTSHKKALLFLATYNEKGLISSKYEKISKRKKVKILLDESLRNGIAIYASIIRNGEVSERNLLLQPMDSTRILKLKLKSIQEPLRPGSEQNWAFEVTQNGNAVTNAELLTSMYDSALDEIFDHSWQQDLLPQKYIPVNWARNYIYANLAEGNSWPVNDFEFEQMHSNGKEYYLYDSEPRMDKMNMTQAARVSEVDISYKTSGGKQLEETKKNDSKRIRSNFNETAFFFPQIHANTKGEYQWSFTLPDALTRWKIMSLVHTKDLKNTYHTQTFEAKKELMLETFEPRFWRKGDSVVWVGKVTNLTDKECVVDVKLKFTDAMTDENITPKFGEFPLQKITLGSNESAGVEWIMFIPENAPLVVNFEAEATTDYFSDIVKKPTPVLSGNEKVMLAENFTFGEKGIHELKLKDLEKISNEAILISYSVQVQPQPLWGTMLSLAKLMEPTNELTESYFTHYFSAQLAKSILQKNPEMKRTLISWLSADKDALTSLLAQNEELKSLVLSETVWFEDAKNETQGLHRLAQLLDEQNLVKVSDESWAHLMKLQHEDGTWSWIGKERSSWYITQHIANGLAWLKGSEIDVDEPTFLKVVNALDVHFLQEFSELSQQQKEKEMGLNAMVIQWLNIRSLAGKSEDSASVYYAKLIPKQWKNFSLSTQAIMGLWSIRKGDTNFTKTLQASMVDRSRKDKKLGMYWTENLNGYQWFENNIEVQAMLVQFLAKAGQPETDIKAMQMWLIQQKRTQMWESTKSSAMACYALQSFSSSGINTQKVMLQLPLETFVQVPNEKVFYTASLSDQNWTKVKSNALLELTSDSPVFANMQVTYSDKAASIQKSSGDFRIERTYYLLRNGEEFVISPNVEVELGDIIRVKLKLVSNRSLDFVYMEDPKAPGWEPMNALSGYQFDDGMYYLSNRDSKTEFFVENLAKGTSNFYYDIKITAKGQFQIGPAKAMCYYAPTFVSNSEGRAFKSK